VIVDTHCHLNHEQLREETAALLERARAAGVLSAVVIGFDLPSSEEAVRLARNHASLYAAVGIHPHAAESYDSGVEARLAELAGAPEVVAIGEIGLDFHYDPSAREAQERAFRPQLALARSAGLPVVIHCREAYAETLDILEGDLQRELGGVMHCWGGATGEAERALNLGMSLGIGGVITFKNAESLREVVSGAPLDRLLLETDAPYLAPAPYRGKRNEPAHARIVAESLAALRSLSVEETAQATTANAHRLFRRMRSSPAHLQFP
jgi:TatD DNase family protein